MIKKAIVVIAFALVVGTSLLWSSPNASALGHSIGPGGGFGGGGGAVASCLQCVGCDVCYRSSSGDAVQCLWEGSGCCQEWGMCL